MPIGECLLCKQNADLQLSHVVPAFVFRWKRDTSGNGFIRTSREPNRRVQDGPQKHWLCRPCEDRIGMDEREFATRVFHPYHNGNRGHLRYGPWMLRFAVSLSWRTLKFFELDGMEAWDNDQLDAARRAAEAWRQFLLAQTRNPGEYRQHLIPVDRIAESTDPDLPSNINRYLMRAVDLDVVRSSGTLFTYTKIGRFILIGSILEQSGQWEGTRLGGNEGFVEPRFRAVPGEFCAFLKQKAVRMAESQARMSDRQHAIVDSTFRRDMDRLQGSDLWAAIEADVEMFGQEAAFRPASDGLD